MCPISTIGIFIHSPMHNEGQYKIKIIYAVNGDTFLCLWWLQWRPASSMCVPFFSPSHHDQWNKNFRTYFFPVHMCSGVGGLRVIEIRENIWGKRFEGKEVWGNGWEAETWPFLQNQPRVEQSSIFERNFYRFLFFWHCWTFKGTLDTMK